MAHLDGALTGLTKGPMQKGNRSLIADARKNTEEQPVFDRFACQSRLVICAKVCRSHIVLGLSLPDRPFTG